MSAKKFITEKVDNLTKKEIAKYKCYDNFEGNGLPKGIKLSNGTEVKVQDTNLDKMSIFGGVMKYKNDKNVGNLISNPKFVYDGRLGYTKYVKPLLDASSEEENRAY